MCNTEEDKIAFIEEKSKNIVIFNDKLWVHSGQPYYKVMTFGLGHNHGGTGLFIDWTFQDNVSKDCYLATEKEKAVQEAESVAAGRGDTKDVGSFTTTKKNIEIIIPEAYTLERDLESSDLGGYFWNDDEQCYIKEYGSRPAHAEQWKVKFTYKYNEYCALLYTRVEDVLSEKSSLHQILGELFMDVRNISFNDIDEIVDISTGRVAGRE